MIHMAIRSWRRNAKISQADAARLFGWSPAFQSAIELGRRPVNLAHVARFARAYRVGPTDVGMVVLSLAPVEADAEGAA